MDRTTLGRNILPSERDGLIRIEPIAIRGKEGHGVGDPNAICPAGCSVAGLMTSIASPPAETTRAPSTWIGM